MSQLPLAALADDFSGAAEIAGVAHSAGLKTFLSCPLGASLPPKGTDAWVIDLDTRRKEPWESLFRMGQLDWSFLSYAHHHYKKTDSVLRGHILLEIQEIIRRLFIGRAVLVPANPARGRIIQDGRYSINGTPLHQTEFGQDPNYPAQTDCVDTLLRERCPGGKGMVPFWEVPDIQTQEDLETTIREVKHRTLHAGASPYFATCLKAWGMWQGSSAPKPPTWDSAALVSGSRSINASETAALFRKNHIPVYEIDPGEPGWNPTTGQSPTWMLKLTTNTLPDPNSLPWHLAECLSGHTSKYGVPSHLLIEGGDTAAAILEKYAWQDFTVIHQWEPGVTTLKPTTKVAPFITTKPGSYPWPQELKEALLRR